jgi:hypothetical protein
VVIFAVFVMSDLPASMAYIDEATSSIFEHYMGSLGEEIADCLMNANRGMPPILREFLDGAAQYRPQSSARQISWGITRRDKKTLVALLLEKSDSDAAVTAEQITKAFPGSVIQLTTARAHSSAPGKTQRRGERRLVPGASIAHEDGFPGSIGCLVRSLENDEGWRGVISASHVLSKGNRGHTGDWILVPGDDPRLSTNQCGTLERFILLPEYDQDAEDANYLCCTDAALVKINEGRGAHHYVPDATYVPRPDDIEKLMPIHEVIGGDTVADRLGERVYKVGRTSGLTAGILDLVGVQRQIISISKNNFVKEFVYTNVLGVARIPGESAFSAPGDSGALVYTADGKGIGLIIGGNDDYSWLSPLDACIRDLNIELLS